MFQQEIEDTQWIFEIIIQLVHKELLESEHLPIESDRMRNEYQKTNLEGKV